MAFRDDIKTKNTSIIPIVQIGDAYFSTNNINIDGVYCKPLIMDIPSIKDSVSLESGNFIISKVTLKLSNAKLDNKRFSESFNYATIINKLLVISYKTPSITSIDSLQSVFSGVVRGYSHTDEFVTIKAESVADFNFNKKLPVASLPSNFEVPDKNKGRKIPMVYGSVERCPAYIVKEPNGVTAGGVNLATTLIVDNKKLFNLVDTQQTIGNNNNITQSAVFIADDSNLLNVNQYSGVGSELFLVNNANFIYNEDKNKVIFGIDSNGDFSKKGVITSPVIRNITGITLDYGITEDTNFRIRHIDANGTSQTDNDFLASTDVVDDEYLEGIKDLLTDGSGNSGIHITGDIGSGDPDTFFHIRFDVESLQDGDAQTFLAMKVENLGSNPFWIAQAGKVSPVISADNPPIILGDVNTYDSDVLGYPLQAWSEIDSFEGFTIGIPAIDGIHSTLGNLIGVNLEVDLKIKEVQLFQSISTKGIINKDFFVNVQGRTKEIIGNNGDINYQFLKNPIEIIRHILEEEIGFFDIDEDSYQEAYDHHSNWEMAFCIKDEIDATKLVADICRSTKSIPRINRDGKFGFITVKNKYNNEDYENATIIKDEDVINYSFALSSTNEVITKCSLEYKKDYVNDTYLAKTSNIVDNSYTYYNYNEDDKYKEFKSDYIRDHITAGNLKNHIYNNNKNTHLGVQYTLPIKYDIKVGDIVRPDKLHQGMQSHGISYISCKKINGQYRYPLFLVTEVSKNLDSVKVKATQLHHLEGLLSAFWIPLGADIGDTDSTEVGGGAWTPPAQTGCTDSYADNYDPDAVVDDGSCVYQQEAIVGCTNPLAFNYNPDATEDDGTCVFNAPFIYGDLSQDGNVNVLDIVQLVHYILGSLTLSEQEEEQFMQRADVSGDVVINVLDVVQIVQYILTGNNSGGSAGELFDPSGTFNELNIPLITPIDMREGGEGLAMRKRLGDEFDEWAIIAESPDINTVGNYMYNLINDSYNVTELNEDDGIGKNIFLHIGGGWYNQGALNANQLASGMLIPNVNEQGVDLRGSLKFRIDMQFDGTVEIINGNTSDSILSYYNLEGNKVSGTYAPSTKWLTLSVFNDFDSLGLPQDNNGFLMVNTPSDDDIFGSGLDMITMLNYPHLPDGVQRVQATLKKGTNILYLHTQDALYGLGGELSEDNFGHTFNSQFGVNASFLEQGGVPYWWNNEKIGDDLVHPNDITGNCSMYRSAYVRIKYNTGVGRSDRFIAINQHSQILGRDDFLYEDWKNWWWLPESAEGEY
jgi:hypothetical protein